MLKKTKNNHPFSRVLFLIIFVNCVLFINSSKLDEISSLLEISDSDYYLGNEYAPVTIIEYASLSCSHCAHFHIETLPKIIDEYVNTGKVKIVFRHFPLNYPAFLGSMLLQCIDKDFRYEYSDALYKLQSKWVKPDPEESQKELYKIMQTGGMTKESFDQCLNNKDMEESMLQKIISAQNQLKINTTPSFFINGISLVGNKPFKDFKKIIDEIID